MLKVGLTNPGRTIDASIIPVMYDNNMSLDPLLDTDIVVATFRELRAEREPWSKPLSSVWWYRVVLSHSTSTSIAQALLSCPCSSLLTGRKLNYTVAKLLTNAQ